MHPALRPPWWRFWRNDLSSVLLQISAYGSGLAGAVLFALYVAQPPKVVAAASAAPIPVPEWVEVERPHPAFAMPIPEAGDAPAGYAILRHGDGGGRKDILTLGERTGAAPYLTVEIYRPGREIERFGEAKNEIVARAAALGLAQDVTPDADLDSKFGQFSIMKFTAGETRKCLGFVRASAEPRMQIAGLFCQSGENFVERGMLTCALDRLTLNAAGGDPKVGALFAQAELRREFCGQRNTLLAPTPKYPVLWKALEQRQKSAAR